MAAIIMKNTLFHFIIATWALSLVVIARPSGLTGVLIGGAVSPGLASASHPFSTRISTRDKQEYGIDYWNFTKTAGTSDCTWDKNVIFSTIVTETAALKSDCQAMSQDISSRRGFWDVDDWDPDFWSVAAVRGTCILLVTRASMNIYNSWDIR